MRKDEFLVDFNEGNFCMCVHVYTNIHTQTHKARENTLLIMCANMNNEDSRVAEKQLSLSEVFSLHYLKKLFQGKVRAYFHSQCFNQCLN